MESEERATEVGETDNWITSSGVILLICLYQGLGLDSSPSPQSPVLSAAGVCVLDGVLYCVGGWSNTGAVKTVERYNEDTNIWTLVADMSVARWGSAVAQIVIFFNWYPLNTC